MGAGACCREVPGLGFCAAAEAVAISSKQAAASAATGCRRSNLNGDVPVT